MTDGILLIDKAAGMTSHDVVAKVKRQLGGKRGPKVGHSGTLDPFATGLLLILIGRATRLQHYLLRLDKTYETTAAFGAISNTGDSEGEITVTGKIPSGLGNLPTGRIMQVPPNYSAVKVDGRRAYDLARKGIEFELKAKPIDVYEFSLLQQQESEGSFLIRCSSGTYVRTLISDLADAYCKELRRTAIGQFNVQQAQQLSDDISFSDLITIDAAAKCCLPTAELDERTAERIGFGQRVHLPGVFKQPFSKRLTNGVFEEVNVEANDHVYYTFQGEPVAVCSIADDEVLHPTVGFRG